MRRCVWSRNLKNGETMARVGPQRQRKKAHCIYTLCALNLFLKNLTFLPRIEPRFLGRPSSCLLVTATELSRRRHCHYATQLQTVPLRPNTNGTFVPAQPCPRGICKVSFMYDKLVTKSFPSSHMETPWVPSGSLRRKWSQTEAPRRKRSVYRVYSNCAIRIWNINI